MALYRRLLSLHRRLPTDFASVGTQFVRSEFKRHKDSKAEYVGKFMQEWKVSWGSLVPRPTPFSVLQFALTIIHGCEPHPCIIVNANRITENGVGLGTSLSLGIVNT